ncbi:MAG: alpha/beta hydrolase-fold protein [Lautropia sp.]|nr:alpha/beta hydrolase-fold protein [Lautropia sp.]
MKGGAFRSSEENLSSARGGLARSGSRSGPGSILCVALGLVGLGLMAGCATSLTVPQDDVAAREATRSPVGVQDPGQPAPRGQSATVGQSGHRAAGWQPAVLPGAQERVIRAGSNGRDYRIQMARVGPPPKAGYPVLYVLDGDAMFPVAALAAQALAMRADENNASSLLVVGVGYPNGKLLDLAARAEDLTPPSSDYRRTGDRLAQRFGGAEAFSDFLLGQLREVVAREYPVNPSQQSLLGHSYGGLFGVYTLLKRPQSFRHYLISSPSIWWNGKRVLEELTPFEAAIRQPEVAPLSVWLSAGEYEQTMAPHLPPNPQRQAMLDQRGMVREMRELAGTLVALKRSGLEVHERIYAGHTHGTVALPAMLDGLRGIMAACRAEPGCGETGR